jgi:TolB-like protein/Flp pilus assembly protein TadD
MPEELTPEAIRNQLARITSSSGFSRNERLSAFLRFVVECQLEGRSADVKESVIATTVFGRKPDYDPKLDSVVRTEALRLRARLAKYYESEGRSNVLVIELPKGGYVPQFHARDEISNRTSVDFSRPWVLGLAVGLGILLVSATLWWWAGREKVPITIAVLPLDNLSHDPKEDYFSDGLTDELIRSLSMIEGLAVRSRASSFGLKDAPKNTRETGKLLGVDYLLEGSVLRSGDTLRVNAQLIRVADDTTAWTARFDRKLSDVFAIQDEISLGIVNELRLKLGLGRRRYETSMEAYDLYLRARAGDRIISPSLYADTRIQALELAVAKDPSFAPAYAYLASLYAIRSIQFPVDHPADELPKMRTMADTALRLDPLLADAHDAFGLVYARAAQWPQSEASFRKALALDANNSSTYLHFAVWYFHVLGRHEEGIALLEHAAQIDPLADDIRSAWGELLMSAQRYREAEQRCLTLSPANTTKTRCLARVRLAEGEAAKAVEMLETDPDLSTQPLSRGVLGYAYAQLGQRDRAEEMVEAAKLPNERALILAGLRDKDRTLAALSQIGTLGAQRLGIILDYPELAFLRGDARVATLRSNLGLPN